MKIPFLITALALSLGFAQVPDSAQVDPAVATPQQKLVEGTELKGKIHGFLKADRSPYLVTGDIVVETNSTLVIEPGVELQFAPGTGLYVRGQFVVAGTRNNDVEFRSASITPQSGDWKGLFITGEAPSEIRNALVSEAETGIAVENSELTLQSVLIEKSSSRGIYARNSRLNVNSSFLFQNEGVAIHIDSYSKANINDVRLQGNNVALYNAPLAITELSATKIEQNKCGILEMGNSHLSLVNSKVYKNKIGISASELLEKETIGSVVNNEIDFSKDYSVVATNLPPSPEIPETVRRNVNESDQIGDLVARNRTEEKSAFEALKNWDISGSVMIGSHYHFVKTERNTTDTIQAVGDDSISPGEHYRNTFQVPGIGTEANINLVMRSQDGKTVEFNAEYTGDSWNRFNPELVNLAYTDDHHHLVLGDFNKRGGEIYMSSLPVFGTDYTLSLLQNNANRPLFEFGGFFGENRKPYLLGDRHPYIYKDYIEDGEAQAQRLAYGGSVKWAPLRRFDATVGFIHTNDEIHDPLLRDGGSRTTITSEPMQQSFSVYADGNWLFYPGDIELNGQIAVGRADTADVFRERAINKVFTDAGVETSSMGTLRKLMANESRIKSLSDDELDGIFGESSTLSRSKMRDSLRTLIRKAKERQKGYENDRDNDRVFGLNWGSQNFATGASLFWNIFRTTISGHIKYIGEDFYSAGSPDQLADTRELGGYLKQTITDSWTFGFGYQINIENAAKGDETNLAGLSEGTRWGIFQDGDSEWFDEHELDNDRTRYIHNFNIDNDIKINSWMNLSVGYNLEYRTQYRPYQLHGNYILEEGIYRDNWFAARKDEPTATIVDNGDTTMVDSLRWARYQNMSNEDYLASKFKERVYRNTWTAEFTFNTRYSTFKAGGRWTVRSEDSEFRKDSLIRTMDLSDETLAKLGYHFGGADYFEHAYPLSATTKYGNVQNRLSVVPRFKSYNRSDTGEREISVDDELEWAFLRRFLVLELGGSFRYLSSTWEDNGTDFNETETDLIGNIGLTVNHTEHLSSEWYCGGALYLRPDSPEDEYKDVYGGVRVNYIF